MRIVQVEEYLAHLLFRPHTKMDIFLKEFFCDLLWIKYIYCHIFEFERFSICCYILNKKNRGRAGGLLVFEDRKVKGPSNIATQFTQFCSICTLGRQYN